MPEIICIQNQHPSFVCSGCSGYFKLSESQQELWNNAVFSSQDQDLKVFDKERWYCITCTENRGYGKDQG